MNEPRAKQIDPPSVSASGRRQAVRSIAGMMAATLTLVGLHRGASAKNKHGKKKRGPAGPAGPTGPAGSVGSVGETGPTGPAGATTISVVEVAFAIGNGAIGRATVACTTGVATGGGGLLSNLECHLFESVPLSTSATEWSVAGKCPVGQSSGANVARVVCLS